MVKFTAPYWSITEDWKMRAVLRSQVTARSKPTATNQAIFATGRVVCKICPAAVARLVFFARRAQSQSQRCFLGLKSQLLLLGLKSQHCKDKDKGKALFQWHVTQLFGFRLRYIQL
jgi:hypothetical protein